MGKREDLRIAYIREDMAALKCCTYAVVAATSVTVRETVHTVSVVRVVIQGSSARESEALREGP